MKAALSFSALMIGLACTRDPTGLEADRVLELLAAHHAPDIDLHGDWGISDGFSSTTLHITPLMEEQRFSVRIEWGTCTDTTEFPATGTLEEAVLTLRSQEQEFEGRRFHLCRFGSRDLLLPEADVWFTRGEDPVPLGAVYARTSSD